jgi:hypothetical protein
MINAPPPTALTREVPITFVAVVATNTSSPNCSEYGAEVNVDYGTVQVSCDMIVASAPLQSIKSSVKVVPSVYLIST